MMWMANLGYTARFCSKDPLVISVTVCFSVCHSKWPCVVDWHMKNRDLAYTDGQSLRTFLFFQNFHSAHLEPSKNLHTKNLLASKVLTVRPFRCTRFLLWEPRQPTARYALTIFFSQHNLLSFQFSRSVSAMLASSNRHWLKTKCSVWDWTFWKKSTSTRMSQRKFNTRRHT